MTQTMAPPQITEKQHAYIVDLAAKRPAWIGILHGDLYETVVDVLLNEQIRLAKKADPTLVTAEKYVSLKRASSTIGALLNIKPSATVLAAPAPKTLKEVATGWIEQAEADKPFPATPETKPAVQAPSPIQRLCRLIDTMPNGSHIKFALTSPLGVVEFFSLDEVKKYGKVSFRAIRKLTGAPGSWHRGFLSVHQQLAIMQQLIGYGWEQAAKDYADKHGRCARCDAFLSDARSRAAKVGEHCAGEWGWPW